MSDRAQAGILTELTKAESEALALALIKDFAGLLQSTLVFDNNLLPSLSKLALCGSQSLVLVLEAILKAPHFLLLACRRRWLCAVICPCNTSKSAKWSAIYSDMHKSQRHGIMSQPAETSSKPACY